MNKQVILETYSKAASVSEPNLCCAVDYREHFSPDELNHIPDTVLDRNYGCGVPTELKSLELGKQVLDLGPGLGRDCFIAARKVGRHGKVFGVDMNESMLARARSFQADVAGNLGYDNVEFLHGRFDVQIPLEDNTVDVIFSNCVNNLAIDKKTAYHEMLRVLKPGSRLSFSDIVSTNPVPEVLRDNDQAWADCVAGVLSFHELEQTLSETGFHGVTLTTDYLWKSGSQIVDDYFGSADLDDSLRSELESVRLYAVLIEAFKPKVDPDGACYFKGQYAMFHGPGVSLQLDRDPDHLFHTGELKEVCEKTATLLKSPPFDSCFTVFEPEGEVEPRQCIPGGACC